MHASAILADSPMLSQIWYAFMNLLTYSRFYGFSGSRLSPSLQLHRSGRTSLLMVTDQIQSVCKSICTRQSICSYVISFFVKLIDSMLYTSYIYLADDVTYVWVHCIRYCKIDHDPRSFTVLNSRFLLVSAIQLIFPVWLLPKRHTWNCLGKTDMFHLKLLINFLSLSIAGQIDDTPREEFARLINPALKQADLQTHLKQILPVYRVHPKQILLVYRVSTHFHA